MSKVKIQGNASGTGVLTVTAPNTSTDRTIVLPDTSGTLLDENSSVPAANLTGTVADARFPATLPAASAANLTAIPAANLTGTVATARLGTGTGGTGNFLRGDGSWQAAGSTSASDLTSGTLNALRLPAGTIVQAVKFSPGTTIQISIGSSSTPSFTEFHSSYRLSITPKFSNSILRLTFTGLISGRNSDAIMSFKFYDQTNSSNVGSSTLGTGSSRTLCNASYRTVDADSNDRHNMIMTAYQAASNTTARTYGVYGAMESNATFDVNMTDTDNAGCSYVTPNFTIEEIAQ